MCPHGEHVVLLTRYAFCNLHGKRVVVGTVSVLILPARRLLFLPCCLTQRKFLMSKILTRSFRDNSCIFCLTVRTCRARVITKVAKILWMVTYDEKESTAKWLIRRQSLCGYYRFREAHEVMRQRPDPMIGGLVYETLSLVCAEFQIANVGGSSHQSL